MLKDLFKKLESKDEKSAVEKIGNALMDGYVDIKAYRHNEDGSKKLVYHDTGDNTITNWMRQAIMLLLSGYSLSYNGTDELDDNASLTDKDQLTKPNADSKYHSSSSGNAYNKDGYCLNGEQYLWDYNLMAGKHYPVQGSDKYYLTSSGSLSSVPQFALFPTKILLGTGCEYTDWQSLKDANEEENATWYTERITEYGDGEVSLAENRFNALVGLTVDETMTNYNSNSYSGTIGMQGMYTGSGSMVRCVTVNDPDTTSNISTSADMARRYGVVGAIKTIYCPDAYDDCSNYLEQEVSDTGRLVKGRYRGAGRPCFIYFTRSGQTQSSKLDWDEVTADISVQRDSQTEYLNRLTFRVIIPAQSSGTGAIGEYNPFNGYTFKQLGLFNDAKFFTESPREQTESRITKNMPCGMMLAVKNIQNFTKTADESIEFTWTLTI